MLYKTFNEDRDYLVNKFRKPVLDPATGADVDDENFRLSIIDLAKSLEKQGFSRKGPFSPPQTPPLFSKPFCGIPIFTM